MSNAKATLEVPAPLVEAFVRQVRDKARGYAEGLASETEIWKKRVDEGAKFEDMRVDVDRHLTLSAAALELADQGEGSNGKAATFKGSAWVLSDVADAVLIEMIDEARNVAFTSPVEYETVQSTAERIKSWAIQCQRIDRTYLEAV